MVSSDARTSLRKTLQGGDRAVTLAETQPFGATFNHLKPHSSRVWTIDSLTSLNLMASRSPLMSLNQGRDRLVLSGVF